MIEIFNVADFKDPSDNAGRTYRQVNAAKKHNIPIGALVEIETGERLRVMMHTRACDQTPLYSIGIPDDQDDAVSRLKWHHGYAEESLTLLLPNP